MNQNTDNGAPSTGRSPARRNGRRRAYAGLTGLTVLAFLGSGVASAHAATPLRLYTAECNPLSLSGAYYVECFADATGGTAPYTYQWSGPSVGQATGNPVRFSCLVNHVVSVSVTVTDAAGDVVSGGDTVICGGTPQ